jgi:hypothetical protein
MFGAPIEEARRVMIDTENPPMPAWTVRVSGVVLVVLALGAAWALVGRLTDESRVEPTNTWGATFAGILAGLVVLAALVMGYRMIVVSAPTEFALPTWMLWFGAFLLTFGLVLQLYHVVTTGTVASLAVLTFSGVGAVGAVAVARARKRARRE